MKYKLAPHVTDEMLKEAGFEVQSRKTGNLYYAVIKPINNKEDIFIPLEDCEYGNRVIQYSDPDTTAEDLNKEHITDLLDKGWVIEE